MSFNVAKRELKLKTKFVILQEKDVSFTIQHFVTYPLPKTSSVNTQQIQRVLSLVHIFVQVDGKYKSTFLTLRMVDKHLAFQA